MFSRPSENTNLILWPHRKKGDAVGTVQERSLRCSPDKTGRNVYSIAQHVGVGVVN